ncbi:CapZ-interacting protein [Myotis davidii]|uniref:CapZ-interacting protein n=1 Tax=Myotis davidii TaxID=225400 RepID=L5LWN9_MYODS|nr:CapZ-interacting protein [Myotis davidii]
MLSAPNGFLWVGTSASRQRSQKPELGQPHLSRCRHGPGMALAWPQRRNELSQCLAPINRCFPLFCQERPTETNANVDNSASPSVAQLAGRFREQAAAAKEVELGQNGEEKSPPSTSHLPKVKVKSSPLIEKLQANLAFDPAALLPGASPKSPGLKATVSPFHSPPSTPSSPSVRSRASEPEEVPISFDQPPEGSHLPCYNKAMAISPAPAGPAPDPPAHQPDALGSLGHLEPAHRPSVSTGAPSLPGVKRPSCLHAFHSVQSMRMAHATLWIRP